MTDFQEPIRQKIREHPTGKGFRTLLAQRLQVTPSYISHFLAGRRTLGQLDQQIALRLLGLSEWELTGETFG